VSRMFPFVTATVNPILGECPFGCLYCWTRNLKGRWSRLAQRYSGPPRLDDKALLRRFRADDFVFAGTMRDLFSPDVSLDMLADVFSWIGRSDAQFLLLTKNPGRLYEALTALKVPSNCVLGATIESDLNYPDLSRAPPQPKRLEAMQRIAADFPTYRTFVSVEPVLKFTPEFPEKIRLVRPWGVAVGYDNYNHRLPEPPLAEVKSLMGCVGGFSKVYVKTVREAWWE